MTLKPVINKNVLKQENTAKNSALLWQSFESMRSMQLNNQRSIAV